jgi:hypothetical protein
VIIITITLPLFTIAIFPPVSTSAQNMTGNMTSSNTTQGASVENMTDVGKTSNVEGGDDGGAGSVEGGGGGGGNPVE